MSAVYVRYFSLWPASHARSRAMISSAVRPRTAPTSTAAFVSPPARAAGVRTTASGPRDASSVRTGALLSSKSRLTPDARFSTEARENGPPESAMRDLAPGILGQEQDGRERLRVEIAHDRRRGAVAPGHEGLGRVRGDVRREIALEAGERKGVVLGDGAVAALDDDERRARRARERGEGRGGGREGRRGRGPAATAAARSRRETLRRGGARERRRTARALPRSPGAARRGGRGRPALSRRLREKTTRGV